MNKFINFEKNIIKYFSIKVIIPIKKNDKIMVSYSDPPKTTSIIKYIPKATSSMLSELPTISQQCKKSKKPSTVSTNKKRTITIEDSKVLALKYISLPDKYPQKFETYSSIKKDGQWIPLLYRDKVTEILVKLDKIIQPIMKKFKLLYASLSENHPIRGKAAVTSRVPLRFFDSKTFTHLIQIRIRNPSFPNDFKKFYNKSTLLAVLFHELAHIKFMDHGKKFMIFLRDVFAYANSLNVFKKDMDHQLPSCRDWENLIFNRKGRVSDKELINMYDRAKRP